MNVIVILMKTWAVFLAISVWCTIGLVVWISTIFRVSSGMAFYLIFSYRDQGRQMEEIHNRLVSVARLWPDGMKAILSIYEAPDRQARNQRPILQGVDIKLEFVSAVVFLVIIGIFSNIEIILKYLRYASRNNNSINIAILIALVIVLLAAIMYIARVLRNR